MEKLEEKIIENGILLNEIKNVSENNFKNYMELLKECYNEQKKEGE
nr:hypothetical protein [Clostridioides difficile]